MYDQKAVRDVITSTGSASGQVNAASRITGDGRAILIDTGNYQAAFAPYEARALLEEVIDRADIGGWLHNPSTLCFIGRVHDLSLVLENKEDHAEVEQKWQKIKPETYNFDDDPFDVRQAIMDIRTRHEA